MVHAPALASFDGVTGGMILDLSEEGPSMQTESDGDGQLPDREGRVRVRLEPSEPETQFETTGYIAWADG